MKTVAIIGAGFSGITTAIHFMNLSQSPATLFLIEKNFRIAGLAYRTQDPAHTLNVPAGNMSLSPCSPNDFLDYCKEVGHPAIPSSFLPRTFYGAYLESRLSRAIERSKKHISFKLVQSEAVDLDVKNGQCLIYTQNNEKIVADQTVIATGNIDESRELEMPDFPNTNTGQTAFIIGTGLTALDQALSLIEAASTTKICMVSRRGLIAHPHRTSRALQQVLPKLIENLQAPPVSISKYLKTLRGHIKAMENSQVDWRDIMASIREITPSLWEALDTPNRQRFLRHLLPYWVSHRHRSAPDAYAKFQQAVKSGKVEVIAGRILNIDPHLGQVTIVKRYHNTPTLVSAETIYNCTGPSSDLLKAKNPLFQQLREKGMIAHDACNLGIQVDETYRITSPTSPFPLPIRYVGPLLKAKFWESTAVPELRAHAFNIAKILTTKKSK